MQPFGAMGKAVRCTLLGLLICLAGSIPAWGQSRPRIDARVNYVYAAQFGFGGYSIGGLSVQVYSLPIGFDVPDVVLDWDLQIGLPVLYGRYELSGETEGLRVDGASNSIGFQPRLQLDIPLTESFRVSPVGSFGFAVPFGSGFDLSFEGVPIEGVDIDDDAFYTYEIGLSSLFEHRIAELTLSLGNAFIYAGDAPFGSRESGEIEGYGTFRSGIDLRHPLGFRLGDLAPDASVFFIYSLFTPALQFTRIGEETLEVPQIFEVGATIGSATPLVLPLLGDLLDGMRIGLGYDRGQDFEAWHLVFGFPF